MSGAQRTIRPEPAGGWIQGLDAAPGVTGIVYLLIFNNGKGYVGETKATLRERFADHLTRLRSGPTNKLYNGWRRNGTAELIVLAAGLNDDTERLAREVEFAAYYDVHKNGYNSAPAGRASPMLVPGITRHFSALSFIRHCAMILIARPELIAEVEARGDATITDQDKLAAMDLVQSFRPRPSEEVKAQRLALCERNNLISSLNAAASDVVTLNSLYDELFSDPTYLADVEAAMAATVARREKRSARRLVRVGVTTFVRSGRITEPGGSGHREGTK